MKLSVSLIVLAAMLSVATASPMTAGPIVDAGRQFATEGHAFAPGAGSTGAHLTAPPARFMAPSQFGHEVNETPRLDAVEAAARLQPTEKLTESLLYITRPRGTQYALYRHDTHALQQVAQMIKSTAHRNDESAQILSKSLINIVNEFSTTKNVKDESWSLADAAVLKFFKDHPTIQAEYQDEVVRLQAEQTLDIVPRNVDILRQHSMAQAQQLEQIRLFQMAMYNAFPDETKAVIDHHLQTIRREQELRFREGQMAHVNNMNGRSGANLQYEPSGPASIHKETSHEHTFTNPDANPTVKAPKNTPSETSHGFQPTRGSTHEDAVPTSHTQATEGRFDEDGEGEGDDWDYEDWEDEGSVDDHQHQGNNNKDDFTPTKVAPAEEGKPVDSKLSKIDRGVRHVPTPPENNRAISAAAA